VSLLQRSLKFLGFSKDDESAIFRVLGAVLLLGQLEFVEKGEGSSVSNKDC
jgi:myosin heavy subunit